MDIICFEHEARVDDYLRFLPTWMFLKIIIIIMYSIIIRMYRLPVCSWPYSSCGLQEVEKCYNRILYTEKSYVLPSVISLSFIQFYSIICWQKGLEKKTKPTKPWTSQGPAVLFWNVIWITLWRNSTSLMESTRHMKYADIYTQQCGSISVLDFFVSWSAMSK